MCWAGFPQPPFRQRQHKRLHEQADAHRIDGREVGVHGDDAADGGAEELVVAEGGLLVLFRLAALDAVALVAVKFVAEVGAEV